MCIPICDQALSKRCAREIATIEDTQKKEEEQDVISIEAVFVHYC
jgi:hypothetical protein